MEYSALGGVKIEDILATHGVYASIVCGVSMYPLLRQKKDIVYIAPISDAVRKYDVLLYKRSEKYILHRVIGFYDEGYVIRGDNTYKKEYVPYGDVVGVLVKYYKRGKEYAVNTKSFALYGFLVQLFYFPRSIFAKFKSMVGRVVRKIRKVK